MFRLQKLISVPLIGFLLISAMLFFSSRKKEKKTSQIMATMKISSGYVNSLNSCTKCALTYNYIFTVHGTTYTGISGSSNIQDEYHYLNQVCLYKSFPVAYDSLRPENSKLLITPADFEAFNIPFPDSLTWVKKYVE